MPSRRLKAKPPGKAKTSTKEKRSGGTLMRTSERCTAVTKEGYGTLWNLEWEVTHTGTGQARIQ